RSLGGGARHPVSRPAPGLRSREPATPTRHGELSGLPARQRHLHARRRRVRRGVQLPRRGGRRAQRDDRVPCRGEAGRDADRRGAGEEAGTAGRAVMPGLIDAHAHMDREGLKSICPSLAGARSIDDVLQRIEALARGSAPGTWIVTMPLGDPPYYSDVPKNLAEGRFPTRWELDRVAPRNPVYIRAIWGYWRHTLPLVSIANSEALRRAGITRETVPPWEGVTIEKDPRGEPTGVFVEETPVPLVELSLMATAPRFSHAERVRALRDSMRIYNAT